MDTQTIVAVIGFGTAAVGLLATVLGRKKEIIHRHLHGQEEPDKRPFSPLRFVGILVLVAGTAVGLGTLVIAHYSDAERARNEEKKAQVQREDEEKKAKAARARLVLSCEEKPLKIKRGEAPIVTVKIERIECGGEVELFFVHPGIGRSEEVRVPDGQSVVTWKLRAGYTPPIGINVIRIAGVLHRYPQTDVEGAVDIRVEGLVAP